MGDCHNYGPFLGPYYNTGPNTGPNLGDPKRDHNFDNPPYTLTTSNGYPSSGLLRTAEGSSQSQALSTNSILNPHTIRGTGLGFRV